MRHLTSSALTVCVVAVPFAALAADLPAARAPIFAPPPPVMAYDWSGIYVGANVGYGFASNSTGIQTNDPNGSLVDPSGRTQAVMFPTSLGLNRNGIIGGGQIGYNYQVQQIVFGIEGDFDGMDSKGSASDSIQFFDASKAPFPSYYSTNAVAVRQDWLATVRGRLGYSFSNFFVYGTGGVAFGHATADADLAIHNVNNPPPDSFAGSGGSVLTGFAVGGGVEYGVTSNLSIRAEYLYYDLGSLHYNTGPADAFTVGDVPGVSHSLSSRFDGNLVRVGLNYRFGQTFAPVPVVARY